MKKIMIVLFSICSLGLSGIALANNHGGGFVGGQASTSGGFRGPSIEVSTVAAAKEMRDDQRVVLRGYIVKSLGDELYLFKDDTGTINVDIDGKRWKGQVITPEDLVEIRGEVDKDWHSIEIDVKRIIKLNNSQQ